ncbi:MAG: VanZ family protein [Sphaerochaetaceae bacterium]|nr:VanZ family protein [Sphaerochaetaceae bacterium]
MKNKKPYIIIVAVIICLIWFQSFLPPDLSSEESSWLTEKIINPVMRFFGLNNPGEGVVRKMAHAFEFAVLGFFSCRLLGFKSMALCFVVAFLDETIQIFTGRGPMIQDVWIDLSGALIGTLIGFVAKRSEK